MIVGKKNKSGIYFCDDICEHYFDEFEDRKRTEQLNVHQNLGKGIRKLDMVSRKRWAFVRLNKVRARGKIDKKEYDDICHHINNGHTFMAFINLNQEK